MKDKGGRIEIKENPKRRIPNDNWGFGFWVLGIKNRREWPDRQPVIRRFTDSSSLRELATKQSLLDKQIASSFIGSYTSCVALATTHLIRRFLHKFVGRRYIDRPVYRAIYRAVLLMHVVHPLDHVLLVGSALELIVHSYSTHYQGLVLFLNIPFDCRGELASCCINPARFQRATKGARQSATGSGDDIVNGCRMGLMHIGVDLIVLSDLRVNTEKDIFVFCRHLGAA